jgi:thioredoxin 1
MPTIKLNHANFENEVKKTEKIVVIDFWASWCAPCRMMSPVIDEIARDYPDVKVCKANVDETPIISDLYKVTSIPTILVVKNNEITSSFVGVTPKEDIEKAIKMLL